MDITDVKRLWGTPLGVVGAYSGPSGAPVDSGEHVDFCRGSVLSTAERSRGTYFTTDKAYGRAAVSQGGVGKRWKNHGVFLRYSYSLGLILPLLASDTPVLALDVLRA